MTTTSSSFSAAERENLRARFGMRVAAALSDRADAAPHDITERLRIAREQALIRAREAARPAQAPATAPATVVFGGGRTASLGAGGPSWWFRLASVLPIVVLAAGLVMIDRLHEREQTTAAAEIDSALLADDLPPDAYSDPGFVQYMKSADTL